MRFINKGESIKIRQGILKGEYKWITLKKGEKIDLPRGVGRRNGLEEISNKMLQKVTTSKAGPKVVETKQFESSFESELLKIKGIAKKTAEDIMEVFTQEGLIEAIKQNKKLPFRDDISKKLEGKYGKK